MKGKYTPEMLQWLEDNIRGTRFKVLAERFNARFGTDVKPYSLATICNYHGLKNGIDSRFKPGEGRPEQAYTKEQVGWISDHIAGTPYKELCEAFNAEFGTDVKVGTLASVCSRYGLKNGRDTRLDGKIGEKTRFQKGRVSETKGKTWADFMSPEGMENARKTLFKPGGQPPNAAPLGTEIWREGYLWRKVRNDRKTLRGNWVPVHRAMWEEHNGPIPEGMLVIFRNGDTSDIRLDNLKLATCEENALLNAMGTRKMEPEARRTGELAAELMAKAYIRRKHDEDK